MLHIRYLGRTVSANTLNQQVRFLSLISTGKFDQRDYHIKAVRLAAARALKMNVIMVVVG